MTDDKPVASSPSILFSSSTVPSPDHPDRNEDAYFIDEQRFLAGIFDGVGGSVAGFRASRIASDEIHKDLHRISSWEMASAQMCLLRAINAASRSIRLKSPGSLTTCVICVAIPFDDSFQLQAASVGDSRLYLLRNSILTLITRDDDTISPDLVQELDDVTDVSQLDQRGLQAFGLRNIMTQALGQTEPLHIHHYAFPFNHGDCVVLTTDGVHDNLTASEIESIAIKNTDPAQPLVDAADKRSVQHSFRSKPDDITAVCIRAV